MVPLWVGALWVLGAYLVGTLPSAYLVARLKGSRAVLAEAHRDASEADAHILLQKHVGGGWSAVAATADVVKAFAYPLVARRYGGLPPDWVAAAGVAVVLGHTWPPYLRPLAGRGLAAGAGALLALLPVQMVVAGVLIVVGIVLRKTGAASTIGFALAPAIAAVQGQPLAYVWMSVAIVLIVVARRLEGVAEVVERGTPWPRAIYYRAVWDLDHPSDPEPGGRAAPSPGSGP